MDKSLKSISEAYLSMLEATKVEVEDEKETDVDTEKKSKESDAVKDDPAANKGMDDEPKKDKKKDDEEVDEACNSKKKMKENLNFMIPKGKAASDYMSRKAKYRQDLHKKQDPKHAKTHARNMVDMDKAEKKAKKKGVAMRDYGRDNWKVRNGVKRGKLPEQFEAMMAEAVELNEASTRDYVDNILPKALKKAGIPCKVTKKTGYTSYDCGDYEIVNDGVGIKVKENGKEIAYYSKPKLDYKKAVEKVNEDVEVVAEASGDKEAYQKFFQSALKKFGVKSPAELDGDKEKEFYDYVDKNWEGDNEVEESVQLDELAKFSDKQIKMAYGIINDKRWKGGNMTHIVKTIEKIAKGLSKHPGVEKAIKATNESTLDSIKSKLKGE